LHIVRALTEPNQAISRIDMVVDYQYFHVCPRA
jgi:hypothetical protein